MTEFAHQLNQPPVRIRRVRPPVARLLGYLLPSLIPTLVDVMLADAVPRDDPRTSAARFGVSLHTVRDVWPATVASD